jgi:hypothetical protein
MGYTVLDPLEETGKALMSVPAGSDGDRLNCVCGLCVITDEATEKKGYDDETEEVEADFEYIPEKVRFGRCLL